MKQAVNNKHKHKEHNNQKQPPACKAKATSGWRGDDHDNSQGSYYHIHVRFITSNDDIDKLAWKQEQQLAKLLAG